MFSKILERINFIDNLIENLVEQVVDPCTTNALDGDIFYKPSLDHFSIALHILVNEHEYHLWLVLVGADIFTFDLDQFSLLLLQIFCDLLVQRRDATLDVVDQYLVHRR